MLFTNSFSSIKTRQDYLLFILDKRKEFHCNHQHLERPEIFNGMLLRFSANLKGASSIMIHLTEFGQKPFLTTTVFKLTQMLKRNFTIHERGF